MTWWHEASQTIDCMINLSLSTSWRVHIADGCRGIVGVHRGNVLRVCTLFIDKAIFGLTLVFGVLTFFFSFNASNSWVIVRSREEEIWFYAVCMKIWYFAYLRTSPSVQIPAYPRIFVNVWWIGGESSQPAIIPLLDSNWGSESSLGRHKGQIHVSLSFSVSYSVNLKSVSTWYTAMSLPSYGPPSPISF